MMENLPVVNDFDKFKGNKNGAIVAIIALFAFVCVRGFDALKDKGDD